jgi:hypothetical protein
MKGVAVLLALLLLSAAPAARVIPLPHVEGEALVIPPNSPVQFRGFDKQGAAHFNGRFAVTGTFTYGCEFECNPPIKEWQENFVVTPDPALAARLPHWKLRNGPIVLYVNHATGLTRTLGTPAKRAALRSGKLANLNGRISIVVDAYEASIVCDGPNYSVRFVAVAKPAKLADKPVKAEYGC